MKVHSTNYCNAFIAVSPDGKATSGTIPPKPDSIAGLQYAMVSAAPYAMTSDDLLVAVTAVRRDVPEDEHDLLRAELFAKGQPCLRSSPLVKTYGWGVHHDAEGRIALVGCDTDAYAAFQAKAGLKQLVGMRSRRS